MEEMRIEDLNVGAKCKCDNSGIDSSLLFFFLLLVVLFMGGTKY